MIDVRSHWSLLVTGILVVGIAVVTILWWPASGVRDVRQGPTSLPQEQENWELWETVEAVSHELLPSTIAQTLFRESKSCRGAILIKNSMLSEAWDVALMWYDLEKEDFTDIVKRDKLMAAILQHITVPDHGGMFPYQAAKQGWVKLGLSLDERTGRMVYLHLDPESCGVRAGWLEFVDVWTGESTFQRVEW